MILHLDFKEQRLSTDEADRYSGTQRIIVIRANASASITGPNQVNGYCAAPSGLAYHPLFAMPVENNRENPQSTFMDPVGLDDLSLGGFVQGAPIPPVLGASSSGEHRNHFYSPDVVAMVNAFLSFGINLSIYAVILYPIFLVVSSQTV